MPEQESAGERHKWAKWADGLRRGDELVFMDMVRALEKAIHGTLWKNVGDYHVAEDLTQEVFLRVWRYRSGCTADRAGSMWKWILTIISSVLGQWFRLLRSRPHESISETVTDGDFEDARTREDSDRGQANIEQQAHLEQAIERLPETERRVARAKLAGPDAPHTELAADLGMTPNAFNVCWHRAKRILGGDMDG